MVFLDLRLRVVPYVCFIWLGIGWCWMMERSAAYGWRYGGECVVAVWGIMVVVSSVCK